MSRPVRIVSLLALVAATVAAFCLAVLTAPSSASVSTQRIALPTGWQPEGIAKGPGGTLYVGSIPTGAILQLNPASGRTRTVVPAREGHAAIGIERARGLLIAAGGMTGKVFLYDARTGEERAALALGTAGETFVNDVAVAGRFAYVTDSRQAVLYKVNLKKGTATTLDLPDVEIGEGNNLNGIVTESKRTAIAVQSNTGTLHRIDLRTGASSPIDAGGPYVNGDGLLLEGRVLSVVQNRDNKIAQIKLKKDGLRGTPLGTITSPDFDVPTTITRLGQTLFAVNARFGNADPANAEFWVTSIV